MRDFRPSIAAIGVIGLAAAAAGPAMAAPVTIVKPNQTVAQTPVIQFKAILPGTLPPIHGHPAVGTVFDIESFSSSQSTPTSPPPGVAACVTAHSCRAIKGCTNNPTWPTKAESIRWWQGLNASLKGKYAWTVGSTYSHQDAEGWIDHCRYTPKPTCSTGAGWTNGYSWNGSNWVGRCRYAPPPSCNYGPGWTGTATWKGTYWSASCYYTAAPPCRSGVGWVNSYTWTGSAWTGSCTYEAEPTCPNNYSQDYAWTGNGWSGSCVANPCPTGAGWTGSRYPNCHYQKQPSCPSGDTGAYSWNGSRWVSNCHAPAPPPPAKITYYQYTIVGVSGFGSGGTKTGPYTDVTPHCHPFNGTPTVGAVMSGNAPNGYIASADAVFCNLN